MGLPLSGRKVKVLLAIKTEDFELVIKGPVNNSVVEAFKLHQDDRGDTRRAALRVSLGALVKVYDPDAGLIVYDGDSVWPCFFEQTNYEFVLERKDGCQKKLAVDHLNKNIRDAITPVGKGERLLTGILNFQDEVGFSRFEVLGEGEVLSFFEIEVFPSKLDYQKDYLQLLQDVNEEVYNLAYDFLMKTSLYAALGNEKQPTHAEFYAIFSAIQKRLVQALERVMQRPHHKIVPVNRVTHPARVKRAGRRAVQWLETKHHLFEKDERGLIEVNGESFSPRKVLDTKKELTYDTYENRYLKWMLRQIDFKLKAFGERYNEQKGVDLRINNEIAKAQKHLQRYSRYGFLHEVGELSQVEHSSLVMQMAPGYRDVYRCYLMLLKGLHITSDLFSISTKGLSELYEYWCFIKINALLRKKYKLERNQMVAVERKGLTINLKKGRESTLEYLDPRNGEMFTLTYNRSFINMPTVSQKPDNILKLEKAGSRTEYQYIFDAKYRISVDDEYIHCFGQPGPPEDTINTMHRYRDAIIRQSKNDIKRDVFGAFVLFPHNDEMLYAGRKGNSAHKFYESLDEVGIGALPFLPGQTKLVEEMLDALLLETSDSAFERTVLQDGTKEYLTKDTRRNVLIGPLGSREQLDICLENKLYYTYLSMVQAFLGELEYVAIYQSKDKFKSVDEQGIHYVGRIQGYKILRRNEIKKARNGSKPSELAVLFQIEEWEKRLEPIKPGGYGPSVPQRTSLQLLHEAVIYPELHLQSLEVRLWREFRRVQECLAVQFPRDQIRESDEMYFMEFPGLLVEKVDNNTFKVTAGNEVKTYSFATLQKRPSKVLREIIAFWRLATSKENNNLDDRTTLDNR